MNFIKSQSTIWILFLASCSAKNQIQPDCNCVVLSSLDATTILRAEGRNCFHDYGQNKEPLFLFGSDSSVAIISNHLRVIDVRDSVITKLYISAKEHPNFDDVYTDKNALGYNVFFESGEKYEGLVAHSLDDYYCLFNPFLEKLDIIDKDTLLFETLETAGGSASMYKGDLKYKSPFLKFRALNGTIKWVTPKTEFISLYSNGISILRLEGFEFDEGLQLGDSLVKIKNDDTLRLFRKDGDKRYRLVAKVNTEISVECH